MAASRLARAAAASSKKTIAPAASASVPSGRFFLSTDAALTREDVVDENGLLQFKTLHEMNHRASIAFRDNELFGTYVAPPAAEENVVKDKEDAEPGTFEWMTYGEYGELVAKCRTVLKDIGEFIMLHLLFALLRLSTNATVHPCHAIPGIGQYDKIGLISNNRWEWAALASAAYSLNAAIVPMVKSLLRLPFFVITLFLTISKTFSFHSMKPNSPRIGRTFSMIPSALHFSAVRPISSAVRSRKFYPTHPWWQTLSASMHPAVSLTLSPLHWTTQLGRTLPCWHLPPRTWLA